MCFSRHLYQKNYWFSNRSITYKLDQEEIRHSFSQARLMPIFFSSQKNLDLSPYVQSTFFRFFVFENLIKSQSLKRSRILSKFEKFSQFGMFQSFFYFYADFCLLHIKTANFTDQSNIFCPVRFSLQFFPLFKIWWSFFRWNLRLFSRILREKSTKSCFYTLFLAKFSPFFIFLAESFIFSKPCVK